MPDDLPFVPDATLDLVDAGWWLDLRCTCGRSTSVPHRLLTQRHCARTRVPDLLARLRCSQYGARPASAEWIDNTAGGAFGSGYPPKRQVPLTLPGDTSPPLPRRP